MTADRRAALTSLPGVRVLTRVPVPPGAVGADISAYGSWPAAIAAGAVRG